MNKYRRLSRKFFLRKPQEVAKKLLGKYIIRIIRNKKIVAKIVETEAYGGMEDKGCHVSRYGLTKRTAILFGQVGYSYVYPVHINMFCLNIVSHQQNKVGAVLIRACQPIRGIKLILTNLKKNGYCDKNKLLNGPAKLCKGLKIDTTFNNKDLITNQKLFVTTGEKIDKKLIEKTERINIPYAEESKYYKWRFIIRNFVC